MVVILDVVTDEGNILEVYQQREKCVFSPLCSGYHSCKTSLSKLEHRFSAVSNPAHGVLKVCDGENLRQWPWLEIRLKAFRRLTISQRQLTNSCLWESRGCQYILKACVRYFLSNFYFSPHDSLSL